MLLEQELLALGIERAQAEKMAAYGARLEEVNQSFNLTRITSPKEMAQKHFYDSLAPVRGFATWPARAGYWHRRRVSRRTAGHRRA